MLRWAAGEGRSLEAVAGGSKRDFGRPVAARQHLDLSALSGITLYEPEELVLTVAPGTALAEIDAVLAQRHQRLDFEPPDMGVLLGGPAESGTIGGAIACNLAGPRRIKAGAARDHVLGFHAVSGRGERFKSGGRVVKNVTGFDLSKLMTGSFGTLAIMTELTVRALPAPEKVRTVFAMGLEDTTAMIAMSRALGSSHEVSGAAHLPGPVAARSHVGYVRDSGASVTAIRIEGPGPSVDARCIGLRSILSEFGELEELHTHNSAFFWREVRDVSYFADAHDSRQIWRLSVPPMEGADTVARIAESQAVEAFYDWGGGLVWLAIPAQEDACHLTVRSAMSSGHATLIRAGEAVRASVPVFQPKPGPLAELERRIKQAFDPRGVLNPGRMFDAT
jgi:glycolate oxidase FAD binding subunit